MQHEMNIQGEQISGRRRYFIKLLPKLAFFAALVLPFSLYAAGGDSVWRVTDSLSGKQQATAAAVDSQGNMLVAGYQNLGGGTNDDYYVVKFKADGSGVAWRTFLDKAGGLDRVTAIAVDGNDDAVVTGFVWNGTNNDIHTIKLSGANGAIMWQHTYDGVADGNDVGTSIAVDDVNNVYVGGYSQNLAGNDDMIILAYSATGPKTDGTPYWQAIYNGTDNNADRITSLAAGASGVAVTGYSSTSASKTEFITLKYTLQGGLVWEKRSPAPGDASGVAVRFDQQGNVIAAGYAGNGTDRDIYTAKYDGVTGTIAWEKTYNGGYNDEPHSLKVDGAGNVYVAGETWTLSGNADFFTAKYSGAAGSLLWQQVFDSGSGNDDIALSMVVDESGDLFVTGYTTSGADTDFRTIKYKKDNGNQLWQTTGGSTGLKDRPAGVGLAPSGAVLVMGWSETVSNDLDLAVVQYDAGLLNPPTNLVGQPVSSTGIRLSWTDNATNEDGFIIERCRNLGCTDFAEVSRVTSPIPPNGTGSVEFTDEGLQSNTYYSYRVSAYNGVNGVSHPTQPATVLTILVTVAPPTWAMVRNGLGNSDDFANAIAVGADNNPIVTGYTHDFAPGYTTGTMSFDYLTMKLDRSTNAVIWSDQYNDPNDADDIATCIAVDNAGNALVSGYATLYNGHGSDVNSLYTIKYPAAGPPESWHDQYNGPVATGATDDRAVAIASATDASGNSVVVGYGKNAAGNYDIYAVKYRADGSRMWTATPFDGNGGDDHPTAVAIGSDGSVFITGYSEKGLNSGLYNFYTAKYDSAGAKVWSDVYSVTAGGDNRARSMAIDALGDVYVTGYATTSSGNRDAYTIKYSGSSSAAQRLWEKAIDGSGNLDDEAVAIRVDPVNDPYDGGIVVAATTASARSTHDHDITVVKYASNGDLKWQQTLQRPEEDHSTAMALDSNGNIYVAGNTGDGTTTDSITVKLDYMGNLLGTTVYAGSANGFDDSSAIAVNQLDEAFVAGYTTNSSGNADYLVYKMTPETTLPSVPYRFSATGYYTTVNLTWSDKSAIRAGYELQRQPGACSAANLNSWTPVIVPGTPSAFTDTGLPFSSTYCYRIRTLQAGGAGSRWNYTTVTTQSPPAPGGLSCAPANTTQVNCTWTDTATGETGYKLERCNGSSCDFSTKVTLEVPANVTTFSDTSVCNSMSYRYRIFAYGSDWTSPYSAVSTPPPTPAPVAPGTFAAARVSEVQISLSWTNGSADQSGLRVYRCAGTQAVCGSISDPSAPPAQFTKVAELGGSVTTFQDTGLVPDTAYTYQLVAFKNVSCAWAVVTGTASAATTTLGPSGLACSANNTTQITCSWKNNAVTQTGVQINRCNSDGTGCTVFTPGAVSSYADASVGSGRTYTYQVRSIVPTAPTGYSPYSSTVSASTPAPPVPTALVAARFSEEQVNLSWTNNATDASGYRVYRCTGTQPACGSITDPAAPPAQYTKVGGDLSGTATTYNDTTVSVNTTYTFQVVAFKNATSAWSVASSTTAAATTTLYAPTNMKAAWSLAGTCNELRFADSDATTLLDYWIESGCATSTTRVWVKVPSLPAGSKQLSLYYGNPPATGYSNGTSTFSLFDDFTGTTLSSQWGSAVTGYGTISVASGQATLVATGYYNSTASISKALSPPYIVESRVKVNGTYPASNNVKVRGLSSGVTGDAGIFSNGTSLLAYFGSAYTTATIPVDQYLRWSASHTGGSANSWSLANDNGTPLYSATYTGTPTGISFSVGDGSAYAYGSLSVDWVRARSYANPAPTYALAGYVEMGSYPLAGGTWTTRWPLTVNNPGSSTLTNYQVGITVDTTALGSDQVTLTWNNNTSVETGITVERCISSGAGITCDPGVAPAVSIPLAAHATTYVDTSVSPASTYCYRVKPTKTGWPVIVSDTVCASTSVMNPPSNVTAAPATTSVNLSWTDNSTRESAFRIERCPGSGACTSPTDIFFAPPNATTYTDTTVCPGTFTYHVMAYRNETVTAASPDVSVSTITPNPPTGLAATRISEAEIDLTWTSGTTDQSGFRIQRCQVPSGQSSCGDFSTIGTVGAAETAYKDNDTALRANTTYQYQVQAFKTGSCAWDSAFSAPASATTTALPPSGCTATAAGSKLINLAWTDNTIKEEGFKIERCEGAVCSNYAEVATAAANAAAYGDTPLKQSTTYSYRIRAYNSSAVPPWASDYCTAQATTGAFTLSAVVKSATSIQLRWGAVVGATGYRIEQVTQTCGYTCTTSYTAVASVGADVTSYLLTGLTSGTTYTYRVVPTNATGDMAATDQVSATTGTAGLMSLNVSSAGGNSLDLAWNQVAAVAGYRIERKTGSTGTWESSPIATVGAGSGAYTDASGLMLDTTYCYRVTAYDLNSDVMQSDDNGICATTGGTPRNLTAAPGNTTEIDLGWTRSTTNETAFVLERCAGSSCDFSSKDSYCVAGNSVVFADTNVCSGSTYTYRLKAVNSGLSQGCGLWTRRSLLTISNFAANYPTRIVLPYSQGMSPDFSDIRFFDSTALTELPYWVESKTDGVSATLWLKTGANNSIYLYYGNPSVSGGNSNGARVFEFFDDFSGSAVDGNKWSTTATPAVAGGAVQVSTGAVYTKSAIVSSPQNRVFEMKAQWAGASGASSGLAIANAAYTQASNSASNALAFHMTNGTNANLAPWGADGTVASYNIVAGPASGQTDPTGTYRIVGFAFRGTSDISYFIKGLDYADIRRSSYTGTWDKPAYLYLGGYMGSSAYSAVNPVTVDWVRVRTYAATEPAVALGAEEYQAAGFAFSTDYESPYSATASATTPLPSAPDNLAVTITTDRLATLTWSRHTTDETGFSIERCAVPSGQTTCSDFAVVGSVGNGVVTFGDSTIQVSPTTTYHYRVRAYKSSPCTSGWTGLYSNVAEVVTVPPAPGNLAASPVNTTQINLWWTDKTVAETAYQVERCAGSNCSFLPAPERIFPAPANAVGYSDASACNGTAYSYRVKAINKGLSNSGLGCWSAKMPLIITNFQPNFQTRLVIPYDPAMQANFADIRFYDATAQAELPYWIESQTDGSTATVWIRTGSNNAIYLYFGNPAAISASNGGNVFDFFDEFGGTSLSAGKWSSTSSATVGNGTVQLSAGAIYTGTTVAATPQNRVFEMKSQWTSYSGSYSGLAIANAPSTQGGNAGSNALAFFMTNGTIVNLAPWGADGSSASYNIASGPASGQSDPMNTYRIVGFEFRGSTQVSYFIKGLDYAEVRRNTYNGTWNKPAYLWLGYYAGSSSGTTAILPMTVDWVRVRSYAATEPAVSLGAKQTSTCFAIGTEYEGAYTTPVTATTPAAQTPSTPVLTPSSAQVSLSWSDANSDETGFNVSRCIGSNCGSCSDDNCSNFNVIAAGLPANTTTYTDTAIQYSATTCYRVTAYKTVSNGCSWSMSSPASCVKTFPAAPVTIAATAVNSFKIQFSWAEPTADQDGFEIETQVRRGTQWVPVATVAGSATAYTDTKGIEPQKPYAYRVRAFRGADKSSWGYSNTVTTPAYSAGDNTCNYQLTIATSGPGTTTVLPAGVSCPAVSGAVCYAYCDGAQVKVGVIPAIGASFTGWSGSCSGSSTSCTVVMDGSKNVSASFQ